MAVNLSLSFEQYALLMPLIQQLSGSATPPPMTNRDGDRDTVASIPVRTSIPPASSSTTPGYGSETAVTTSPFSFSCSSSSGEFTAGELMAKKTKNCKSMHKVTCW